jgi:energy-coupling factor transporter ATP-binding protein EcfA2
MHRAEPPDDPPVEEPGAAEPEDRLAAWVGRAQLPPEADRALVRWLDRELKEDQYARLEQAGHSVEDAIPLAPVFIDLEALPGPVEDPPVEVAPENGFLFQALGLEPQRLWTLTFLSGRPEFGEQRPRNILLHLRGIVLIGGPGQGKSTVGQILCQIHRAALLAPRAAELPRDGHRALDTLRAQLPRDGVRSPAAVLLPLRIVLRDFAAWTAINGVEPRRAVLEYLAHLIRRSAGHEMGVLEIRQLLVHASWLLLLDGLDEVPASAGREAMLTAVREFLQGQADAGSRGVVVATTRPQGYSGELGDLELETRYLAPLSTARALAYAERLVVARYPGQPDRQERIRGRLLEASANEATARLMRSPLQVTILAALVDRFGRPPEERWGLFHGYFRVVYEREMERPGPVAELLRSHRPHIEQIHARVGLLLQVETERSGGTAALMSRKRLEQVVDATLAEDDDDPDRRARLTRTILDAAENRLVFLVSPQDGKIGFEVRSLQEMMAAWALADKTDAVVEARLVQIAPAASFRNVLLFVASRCFAERSDLRDAFTARICPQLNEADEVSRTVLAGSMLALEILEDRSARSQPKHQRALARVALRLLELPPDEVHRRVALACVGDAEVLLRTALEEALGRVEPAERLSGWVALMTLVDRGVEWARAIADRRWPDNIQQRQEMARCVADWEHPAQEWLMSRIAAHMDSFPPELLVSMYMGDAAVAWLGAARTVVFGAKTSWSWPESYIPILDAGVPTSLRVLYGQSISVGRVESAAAYAALLDMPDPPAAWRPWIAVARFVENPGAKTLGDELDRLADDPGIRVARDVIGAAPWPLGACIAGTADELRELARRARRGELGELDDWKAAEERWRQGVDVAEIAAIDEDESSLSRRIRLRGLPIYLGMSCSHSGEQEPEAMMRELLGLRDAMKSTVVRMHIARVILDVLADVRLYRAACALITPEMLEVLWQESQEPVSLAALGSLLEAGNDLSGLPDMLLRIEKCGYVVNLSPRDPRLQTLVRVMSDLYREAPERHGLLSMLATLVSYGSVSDVPASLLDVQNMSDLRFRRSATIVALAQGIFEFDDADRIAENLVLDVQAERRLYKVAASAISAGSSSATDKEHMLCAFLRHTPRPIWSWASSIVSNLTKSLRTRKSGIDDPATWARLGLPEPLPGPPPVSEPLPSGDIGPIGLIELRNLRLFDHLTIETRAPEAAGQWIILLGDNGMGKTTVLRAVALALVEPELGTILLSKLAAPFRRRDAPTGACHVRTHGGDFYADILQKGDLEIAQARQATSSRRPLVFGYGCRRGSALGGPGKDVSLSSPTLELATLFDESANLVHAETWLKERALEAEQNKGKSKEAVFHAVLATLTSLLPDAKKVEVRDNRVWVDIKGAGWVPLAALSDGYVTTAGWVIDLVARWIDRATRRGDPVEANFTETMEGLVLVDEIDLHLHPRWQRDVIELVRRRFPKMSFVVTTHNPLTLLGARPGEIHVLRRDHDDRVEIVQRDLPPGLSAERILTGDWFGLPSTLDDQTLALLAEHQQLILDKGLDAPEAVKVEDELRRRLGSYADTSIERLAHEAALRVVGPDVQRLTPDERRDVQEKIAALLREPARSGDKPRRLKGKPAPGKRKAGTRGAR